VPARCCRGHGLRHLNVKRTNAVSTIRINEEVLSSIVKVAGCSRARSMRWRPSIDGLLGIKGSSRFVEPESDEAEETAAKAAGMHSNRRWPNLSRCASARA